MRVVIAAEPGRLREELQAMLDSIVTLEWVTIVDDGVDKVLLKGFTAAELSDAISQLSNHVRG